MNDNYIWHKTVHKFNKVSWQQIPLFDLLQYQFSLKFKHTHTHAWMCLELAPLLQRQLIAVSHGLKPASGTLRPPYFLLWLCCGSAVVTKHLPPVSCLLARVQFYYRTLVLRTFHQQARTWRRVPRCAVCVCVLSAGMFVQRACSFSTAIFRLPLCPPAPLVYGSETQGDTKTQFSILYPHMVRVCGMLKQTQWICGN